MEKFNDADTVVIKITRNKVTNELWPTTTDITELLAMTGDCPLIINWLENADLEEPLLINPLILQKYFQIFLSVVHRWKGIHIWAPYIPPEVFDHKSFGPTPFLECVHLRGPEGFDIPLMSQCISEIWRCAPRFQTYMIEQFHEHASVSDAPRHCRPGVYPPIANFTTIHLDNIMSVMECIEVLYAAEKLVHCRFGNVSGPKPPPAANFSHATLESLHLASNFKDHDLHEATYLNHVFEIVRTPALRRLSVECDDNWDHSTFMQFFIDSGNLSRLEALEFNMVKMWELQFQEILWCLPKLRVLKVHADSTQYPLPVSRTVIDRLTYKGPDRDMICLELELISINDDALAGVQDGTFADMIWSRTQMPHAHLERVWFATDEENEDHEQDVQKLHVAYEDDPSGIWEEIVIHTQMSDWDCLVREKLWPSGLSADDSDEDED